jgi:hypothetical protein
VIEKQAMRLPLERGQGGFIQKKKNPAILRGDLNKKRETNFPFLSMF